MALSALPMSKEIENPLLMVDWSPIEVRQYLTSTSIGGFLCNNVL